MGQFDEGVGRWHRLSPHPASHASYGGLGLSDWKKGSTNCCICRGGERNSSDSRKPRNPTGRYRRLRPKGLRSSARVRKKKWGEGALERKKVRADMSVEKSFPVQERRRISSYVFLFNE